MSEAVYNFAKWLQAGGDVKQNKPNCLWAPQNVNDAELLFYRLTERIIVHFLK